MRSISSSDRRRNNWQLVDAFFIARGRFRRVNSAPNRFRMTVVPSFPSTPFWVALFAAAVGMSLPQGVRAADRNDHSARPVIYNYITKEGEPIDQMIRDRYGRKYELVELRKEPTYVNPRLTKAPYPVQVFDDANMPVYGSVRVCFVITTSGRLVDPFIIGTANPLLAGPVLEILKEFRAVPARVKGAPVAVVESLKFRFGTPRRRLDTFR